MTLTWSDLSIQHLNEIISYISTENPPAAKRVVERIATLVETVLPEQPLIGRPGRAPRTRELVITQIPYIVAYRLADTEITIVAVIHGARKWPSSL